MFKTSFFVSNDIFIDLNVLLNFWKVPFAINYFSLPVSIQTRNVHFCTWLTSPFTFFGFLLQALIIINCSQDTMKLSRFIWTKIIESTLDAIGVDNCPLYTPSSFVDQEQRRIPCLVFRSGFPVPSAIFSFSFNPSNPLCFGGVITLLGVKR